jgi:hypothetical protein
MWEFGQFVWTAAYLTVTYSKLMLYAGSAEKPQPPDCQCEKSWEWNYRFPTPTHVWCSSDAIGVPTKRQKVYQACGNTEPERRNSRPRAQTQNSHHRGQTPNCNETKDYSEGKVDIVIEIHNWKSIPEYVIRRTNEHRAECKERESRSCYTNRTLHGRGHFAVMKVWLLERISNRHSLALRPNCPKSCETGLSECGPIPRDYHRILLERTNDLESRSSVWNDDEGAASNFMGRKNSRTMKFHRNIRGS